MGKQTTIHNVVLRGIAGCIPSTFSDNTEFEPIWGKDSVDKFRAMTGVLKRHIAQPNKTCSDYALVAIKQLLAHKNLLMDDIDALVFVSQTPDYLLPATACVLHKKLGGGKNILAFDVNLGCSGFVYGCSIAASLLMMEGMKRVVLCGGDTPSKIVAKEDKSSAMLFGDGSFAALFEKDFNDNVAPWHCSWGSDGTGYDNIIVRNSRFRKDTEKQSAYLFMDGLKVFNFSIDEVPPVINEVLKNASLVPNQIDGLVMHQANLFMLKQIAKMSRFKMNQDPITIDKFGNTSVSSIPLTLCSEYAQAESRNLNLVLAGFGVGLSWGVIQMEFLSDACCPIQFAD